jgi:hypothetical protein
MRHGSDTMADNTGRELLSTVMEKLVPRYDKCLSFDGDLVGK